MEPEKKIYPAMVAIMSSITALEKSRQNQSQGYRFRGIDDVYNMLHEIMADNGVFCLPTVVADRHEERTNQKGTCLIYRIVTMRYTFVASDGSSVEATAIGEGMDSGDKATNKAMSAAQKYALLQSFLIPTEDEKDSENDSPKVAPRQTLQAQRPPKQQPPPPPSDDEAKKAKFVDAVNTLVNKHQQAGAEELAEALKHYNVQSLAAIKPADRATLYNAMLAKLEPKN